MLFSRNRSWFRTWAIRSSLAAVLGTGLVLSGAVTAAGAATTEPYRIGYLVDASGTGQGIFKATLEGFQLYVDRINAQGGIRGRQIEVLVRDVQADPARSASAATELAGQGAIVIAGLTMTNTHLPVYTAAARVGVPVLTGFPANVGAGVTLPPARKGVFGVGLAFELTGEVGGDLARRVSPEGKTFVCAVFETPGGFVACHGATEAAKAQGFTRVETVTFPVALRDFRAVAERISALKPDVLLTIFGRGRTLNYFPALSEAGFTGKLLSMECGTGDDELRAAAKVSPGFDVYSYSRYAGAGQSSGPELAALEAAASKAGVKEVLAFHAGGWTLGLVLSDALSRCEGNCNAAQLEQALSHTNVDTGGLTDEPITFTPDDHYGGSSYRLYRYEREADVVAYTGDLVRIGSTPRFPKK